MSGNTPITYLPNGRNKLRPGSRAAREQPLSQPGPLPRRPRGRAPQFALQFQEGRTHSHPHAGQRPLSGTTSKRFRTWRNTGKFYQGFFLLRRSRHTPFGRTGERWMVRACPLGESVSLARLGTRGFRSCSAPGRGVGTGRLWTPLVPGVPAVQCHRLVGLDVQRGLLARKEPEHGSRHGLHVDLQRWGGRWLSQPEGLPSMHPLREVPMFGCANQSRSWVTAWHVLPRQ